MRYLWTLTLLLAAGGVFYLTKDRSQTPGTRVDERPSNPTEREIPRAETMKAAPVKPPRQGKIRYRGRPRKVPPGPGSLLLPDGSCVPVLNGAVGAPPLNWPKDRPWSPIKRLVVDPGGQEWYEHEDGSFSTTVNTWRQDLGRMDPLTNLFNPEKELPQDMTAPDRPSRGGEARGPTPSAGKGKKGP